MDGLPETKVLKANENYFLDKRVGIAIPGISRKDILHLVVGIPSRDEQNRIVAKVDELMALCDKLEAQQERREALSKLSCRTALHTLTSATTSSELSVAWRRVEEHMPLLLNTIENVQSYRGAILDLAMSGLLLAPEDRSTSTGAEFLAEIAQRRTAWTKTAEGQERTEATRMQRKLQAQRLTMPNRHLSEHWEWGSFLQIAQAVVDCHNKTAPYVPDGIHLVRTSDIRRGRMELKYTKKISEETYAYWAHRLPPKSGDVLFTREAPMGEAAIIPEGEKVCLGQRMMLIRLFPELFNNKFLLYAIYSPSFQERMAEAAIGLTVKHLRVGAVEDLLVPVPPKEEQDRIVAVVDGLLAYCDQLELQLSRKLQIASDLAKASVEVITGIRAKEQKKMKAPKTELVSTLRVGVSPTKREQAPLTAILVQNNGELSAKTLWNASGLEIDAFYQQLKIEMARDWIVQPEVAYMREVGAN